MQVTQTECFGLWINLTVKCTYKGSTGKGNTSVFQVSVTVVALIYLAQRKATHLYRVLYLFFSGILHLILSKDLCSILCWKLSSQSNN